MASMRFTTAVSLLLTFLCALALAAETERSIDVFAWPLSSPKATTLAKLSYNSTTATVKSYAAPSIPASDSIVRIGFYHGGDAWSGIATSASNFAEGKDKTLQLLLDARGEVFQVAFKAGKLGTSSRGGEASNVDGLSVEVVPMREGPTVHLNKPVIVNEEGKIGAEEPEKTFLQKYWWAIGAFVLIQVVMSGSKGE